MRIIADLHIHSHYSRATSKQMNIEELCYYAKRKGLDLLGTGDFTHPLWLNEIEEKLEEVESNCGVYSYKGMYFILSGEVSLVYLQEKKLRKVHLVILSKSFDDVKKINEFLENKTNLKSDGRPTIEMSCPEFVEKIVEISEDNFIFPAHAWTPWFGIFGSKSGFDSIKECFQDQEKNIHAIETGLSSDPEMNWRLSSLDKFTLLSNSDSHSPWSSRIGRECNVFEMKEISYDELIKIIKNKDSKKFLFTIEVDPSYGKYHYDGHRNCNVILDPEESLKLNNICPVCKKPLTIGVLHRVEELADRPRGFVPKNAIPFIKILPLTELIAKKYKLNLFSKKVFEIEEKFISRFGSELATLLNANEEELKEVDENLVDLIIKNREGKLNIKPGYDGVYGELLLEDKVIERKIKRGEKNIRDFL
ncbi:MAG: endonuclease Q family protein [Candidatus Aenigmatarchaeota archaeon]|nr:endonuclease Q family protein [Candidatus Aenigmarchaeota archaeon]